MQISRQLAAFLVLAVFVGGSDRLAAQSGTPLSSAEPACRLLTPVVSESAQLAPASTSTFHPSPARVDDLGPLFGRQTLTFHLESEQAFQAQLRHELPEVKDVQFPKDMPPARATKGTALFPAASIAPVSAQLCYRPLYFKEPRTERYGVYVPCVQPLISMSKFYCDVVALPCRLITAPPWAFECAKP